ncbi:protein adenylyltransferase SelO [Phragmitibacter flavus]
MMEEQASIFLGSQAGWRLEHSYAQLPEMFHVKAMPVPVKQPKLVVLNDQLAGELGLNAALLRREEGAAIFAGNELPHGAEPIAQAYAGHQFGNFTMLGDGRAILLGEQITPKGERFDVQLKGPGPTPFSRRGDGRAALGPMLREYVISEAMFALGIPTTRSLAVTLTGEMVHRQESLPGAVLTRVAASHIRVGTFEWAAARGDRTSLKALADYTIARHYAELVLVGVEKVYVEFFRMVMERQAALLAQWQLVGFIHGVMNTDNMSVCGETIDYGPCAFMDAYDPATVFSSIDQRGRYAYGNQPLIAQWNLARLAEALLPLFGEDEKQAVELANEMIESFKERIEFYWLRGMRRKLGLFSEEPGDRGLADELLEWMHQTKADFTNTFRDLPGVGDEQWRQRWMERLDRQEQTFEESVMLIKASNPAFIPRNHRVEEALEAAVAREDLSVMERLLEVLEKPYEDSAEHAEYRSPGGTEAEGYQTFCGT